MLHVTNYFEFELINKTNINTIFNNMEHFNMFDPCKAKLMTFYLNYEVVQTILFLVTYFGQNSSTR